MDKKIKYILVTGGMGFIGFHLTSKLVRLGFKVIIIDNLSNSNIKSLDSEVIFLKFDLSDYSNFKKLESYNIESIYHLAAQSSNAISFEKTFKDLNFNQLSTFNLLKFAKSKKITRFIYTSSMSVYGDSCKFPTGENSIKNPESFYGAHKLVGEYYCKIFKTEMDFDYTIFRLYSVYGFGQNVTNLDQGLLSIYLGYLINGETIIVKGSGDRERDLIHVEDVTDALIKSKNENKTYNQTYNLGSGKSIKIKEIIEILLKVFNKKKYSVRYLASTKGDPFKTLADNLKLKKELKWDTRISIKEGIIDTAKKYLELYEGK